MTDKENLPTELEEKIQAIAGDIYVQIEDKISTLISEYTPKNTLTNETVEQHAYHQQFKKTVEIHQKEAEQITKAHQEKINVLQNELTQQHTQIAKYEETIQVLNNAKFTDNSAELEKQLTELSVINEAFVKNDKAKTATVEAQNNQISDLQLQVMKVTAELERIQAEQVQAKEAVALGKNETSDLQEQIDQLTQQVTQSNEQLKKYAEQVVLSQQSLEKTYKEKSLLKSQFENIEKEHQVKLDELTINIAEESSKSEKDQLALKQIQEQLGVEQNKYQQLNERLAAAELQHGQDLTAHQILKEQVASFKAETLNKQGIVNKNKEKQEEQYAKARETIKYLRDDNIELNTKLEQQVGELENKLTEYRLRFEYAQKQLAKTNT